MQKSTQTLPASRVFEMADRLQEIVEEKFYSLEEDSRRAGLSEEFDALELALHSLRSAAVSAESYATEDILRSYEVYLLHRYAYCHPLLIKGLSLGEATQIRDYFLDIGEDWYAGVQWQKPGRSILEKEVISS